ncbi:unnamed protein product [Bursaphelenchus xylophilus]|uniref:(pine wood nematode) hypothetical protein n=1 Tax=Bursaphelenchus xylophilus TaxID=6326 RepID=A0A1I7RLB7_BURXY|nr:unnamed protein product [Bursaphelenchus xylophilus]CAG9083191.1 unnamed protein product [Bursaphelenchus xylophilus]
MFGTSAAKPGTVGLFGNASSTSIVTSQPSSLFGQPTATKPAEPTNTLGIGTSNRTKTSPLDSEVPQQLTAAVDQIKNAIKGNNDKISEFNATFDLEYDAKVENTKNLVHQASRRLQTNSNEVEKLLRKSNQMLTHMKVLSRINEENRVNPSSGFQSLMDFMEQSAENLRGEIDEERVRIVGLEAPLKEYINVKEGVAVAEGISKKDMFDHIHRTVAITDDVLLRSSNIHEQVERMKKQHVDTLRRLQGRYVPSPFASDESEEIDQFEYDPKKRMRGPNIFPSAVTLLSLAEGLPKAGLQPQATSTLGGFSSTTGTTGSLFGPKPAGLGTFGTSSTPGTTSLFGPKPAGTTPFGTTATSTATSSTGGLFGSKPSFLSTSTAGTTATPSLTTGTSGTGTLFGSTTTPASTASATPSLFGSILNTSSSGTLFGGTANKPMFGDAPSAKKFA